MSTWKRLRPWALLVLGGAIQAFGLYNIHSQSGVTEGGVLGLTLLLQNWFHWSPAVTGFILNFSCYALGWRVLGWNFIWYSAVASLSFSGVYAICEQFPPLWPGIAELPLLAALLGAVFIGVGAGLGVRVGGASGGDDALSMSLNKLTGIKLATLYLVSDLIVLGLSITYIPIKKLLLSLLTVILSGQLIGLVAGKQTKQDINNSGIA